MSDSDWFSCGDSRPWTKSSIRELKHAIIDGGSRTDILSYQELSLWYGQALSLIVQRLRNAGLSISSKPVDISFRVKTIDTLRGKLRRQPEFSINQIHDVMGARVVANMSLNEQDDLAKSIAALFDDADTIDLRDQDHSGYRAVHVVVKLPATAYCEIQLRTSLQDEWANCYEVAADIFGRKIRYGEFPEDMEQRRVVELLQQESIEYIRQWEEARRKASIAKERSLNLCKKADALCIRDAHLVGMEKSLRETLTILTTKTQENEAYFRSRIRRWGKVLESNSQLGSNN